MKRILVVDDGVFMRSLIKKMLIANGYEIAGEAEDGESAVERYRELRPDIVTMDITMPKQDGVYALEQIMSIDPSAAVVMVSALGQEENVKRAIRAGAKGFVVKPFNEATIMSVLSSI